MLPDKSTEAPTATSSRLLNGRYELAEKVGDGSFFTVYRGRDTQSGRAVAIKLLNEEYSGDREFVSRLQEETRQAMRLSHPHIVPVYDVWQEGGQVGIVTEFVRGINLKDRVRRVAPFPLAVAIDIAAAIAEALEYAVQQGISHGDLRPENILVTPEGQVKLADFGVGAAVCASSRLQMSTLLHSAHYLPPEVAQGKPPSSPSDVYSLGAILFEMLAGQPPFQADTPFAIAVKHLHDPPPVLRRFNPGAPKAVEGIVLKCLQKEPSARYQNTEGLLADLRSVREALRYGRPLSWTPTPEGGIAPRAATAAPKQAAPAPPRRAAAPPGPREAEPSSGEPSTRLLILLPLMALVLAGAVFALFVFNTQAPKDTLVPSIRGLQQEEAQRRLAERGLTLRVVRERHDDKVPRGTVIVVNPPEGTQVKQGKAIDVWVSKGAEPAVVPSLADLTEQDARARIREARLAVGPVRREYDEVVPQGTVISQEPAAGTEVKPKATVSFVVSRGWEPLPPPEPDTPPEPVLTPPGGDTEPDDSSTDGAGDTGSGTTDEGGTLTVPLGGGSPTAATTDGEPANKNRVFDVTTRLEGSKGWSRLRIVLTDEGGRRQVVNEVYRKGQTVRKTIKATGEPGTVKIEVYENGKLAKHQQY
jgi:eukaryotic-like serine/threonine-protein kinase